jgi:hypothetical protein
LNFFEDNSNIINESESLYNELELSYINNNETGSSYINNELELTCVNNEFESTQTDLESNSELEEILENDNDFIEYFSDNSGNIKILIFVIIIIIIFYIYYLNYIEPELELNDSMRKALQLLELKARKGTLTNQMYQEILEIFNYENVTLYSAKKFLENTVNLGATFVDICVDSCCAFTGQYKELLHCPICNKPRYLKQKARKKATYFSLEDRFKIQFQDQERVKKLLYRSLYQSNEGIYNDIFDGILYKTLCQDGFFSNPYDICLIGSTDGYQIFRQKRNDCWVFLYINANLPPDERVKKENLLIAGVIPGPNSPKKMDTFLQPLVDELKKLERKYLF